MRIGYNLIQYDPSYVGGVNVFSEALLKGFCEAISKRDTLCIFVSDKNGESVKKILLENNCNKVEVFVYNSSTFFDRIGWRISSILISYNLRALYKLIQNIFFANIRKLIENNVEVLYTPTTVQFPLGLKVKTFLSMHDIQHVHFPSFFSTKELRKRDILYGFSAKDVSILQASSLFIKKDFLRHFKFLNDKDIIHIPEGVNVELFSQEKKFDIISKYNLNNKFLFYPAQMWPHKSHATLIKAIKKCILSNKDISLVLTGNKNHEYTNIMKLIQEEDLNKNIVCLGKIPYEDVIELYKNCFALINTSTHESNCLPILEAAAAGKPIIASDITPNIELAMELKLNLFKVNNVDDICKTITKIWTNENLVVEQVLHNKVAIKKYSWRIIAEKYLETFRLFNS